MATKTDRILGYLPSTFRVQPPTSALRAVADAFGTELLLGENSLVEVMRAHWVDHADRGEELIDDLARLASLYGLAPRDDEEVEEFRDHLKRYIRTFLEGTVTVQGVLRVAAEALALRIADDYEELDTWWTRPGGALVTREPRGDDAAELVLGARAPASAGAPARRAELRGAVDLGSGIEAEAPSALRLSVDGGPAVDVDLAGATGLDEVVAAIEAAAGAGVAAHDGRFLHLSSPTAGAASELQVHDVEHDAAERLLGLRPLVYRGTAASHARVTGPELPASLDLSVDRYLRLEIDGTQLAEIDCAGADPANTSLDEIRDAINGALGLPAASHDGSRLSVTSPTAGLGGSVAVLPPAAQDATSLLLGAPRAVTLGLDEQPARVRGTPDLGGGVDLSATPTLELGLDGDVPIAIDCRGADPVRTRPSELVAAINAALGAPVASHDGRRLTLVSPTAGPDGELAFVVPSASNAAEPLLGLAPRRRLGADATSASLVGLADLAGGVDLRARARLLVSIDGGPFVEVDLRSRAADPAAVSPAEIVDALDDALGPGVASDDGAHVILSSPTVGSVSAVAVEPLEDERRRRFVTRALVRGEAAEALLGFGAREARGTSATRARLVGAVDLSRGADLRPGSFLRLSVDGAAFLEIDCAGERPRATTLEEVVARINAAVGLPIAGSDGRHLVLTSPSSGAGSRIAVEPTRAADAAPLLGVDGAAASGRPPTGVRFVGTADLSAGVDLPAGAAVRIGLDGADPIEIVVGGPEPHRTLVQLVAAINVALGQAVASHDGTHLVLASPAVSASSGLDFAVPDGTDSTLTILGIQPPRSYRGSDAAPAVLLGRDLAAPLDLRLTRFLRLTVDDDPPEDVDCAAIAADPGAASLDEVVASIEAAVGPGVASRSGDRLALASRRAGSAGRIAVELYTQGDARETLLGRAAGLAEGSDPLPATITGEVDLRLPVDLGRRTRVRIAVDGGRPVEIDVAGADPATTFGDEAAAALNAVLPGLAEVTAEDRLRLSSPTAGEGSRLDVLPLRHLEVVEYPPEATASARQVRHGDAWTVVNESAAEEVAAVEISAPQGAAGPGLVSADLRLHVRLLEVLATGERARLERDRAFGLRATIRSSAGSERAVPGSRLLVGPLGAQAWVPFEGEWTLSGDDESPAMLQLNDPLAPNVVVLRARQLGPTGRAIAVSVAEAMLPAPAPTSAATGEAARLIGRVAGEAEGGAYALTDADGAQLALLRSSPAAAPAPHAGRVVAASGPLHAGMPPVMVVDEIAGLFDVHVRGEAAGEAVDESYEGVTIGTGGRDDALVARVAAVPSRLVAAADHEKDLVLSLPRGPSAWRYLDCHASRFDQARFDAARFAVGPCRDRGVFDVSRFARMPPEPLAAVFAASGPVPDPAAEVVLEWTAHRPGAFAVNLPADLPARFGGRFDEARLGHGPRAAEVYRRAVTEPTTSPSYLPTLLTGSTLVEASVVPAIPLGWAASAMPFRKPRSLTLGTRDRAARLYLSEEGIDGFMEVRARTPGEWGNDITLAARAVGPAQYDVTVAYEAARFESARKIAAGAPPPAQVEELLHPTAVGVLQAKAAGVRAAVTRDGAGERPADHE